jgi:acyl-coenzyme A synthetase/AMP-(fatty) acid ligase
MHINTNFITGAQAVARWAHMTPRAIAIMEGDASYSYQKLLLNSMQALELLRSAGLRRGMIVGLQTDVRYLHLILILACEIGGATHFSIAPPDLRFDNEILERCDILCVEAVTAPVAKHRCVIPLSLGVIDDLAQNRFTGDAAEMLDDVYPPDTVIRIGSTSGTTGGQKFICDTRRSLWHIARGVQHILKHDRTRYPFVSTYRFSQRSTYSDTMLALEYGLPVVYCTGADFFPAIQKLPACHTFLVVGDASRFAAEASGRSERVDTCSLRVIGGPLSPSLRTAITTHLTAEVRGSYSSNETSFVALTDDDTVATLLPDTEVRIVGETGQIKQTGEAGIILVRSPRMSAGYLWDDALNAKHFADGWFRTSDLGVVPEPGKLIVLGRADDILNIGGIKLAPYPLEERIRSIDGVAEAVLLSFVNAKGIGELHVFVERAGKTADAEIGALMVTILERHAATFTAHYCSQIPRTVTGKVRRNLLVQHLEQFSAA